MTQVSASARINEYEAEETSAGGYENLFGSRWIRKISGKQLVMSNTGTSEETKITEVPDSEPLCAHQRPLTRFSKKK